MAASEVKGGVGLDSCGFCFQELPRLWCGSRFIYRKPTLALCGPWARGTGKDYDANSPAGEELVVHETWVCG